MPYRLPPPQTPPPRVSLALLANIAGLVLLVAAVVMVLVAAYRYDTRLALAAGGVLVGVVGWRLTTVADEA